MFALTSQALQRSIGVQSKFQRWHKMLILVVLCGVAMVLGLLIGAKIYSLSALSAIFSADILNHDVLVIQSRFPRIFLALLTGAAFAVSGCLTQALTRNPLADSGLLGIHSGASASIVLCYFLPWSFDIPLFWQALPGACLCSFIIYMLAKNIMISKLRLILAGATLSIILNAFVQTCMIFKPALFFQLRHWNVGSLSGLGWAHVWDCMPYITIGLILSVMIAPLLNILVLDQSNAQSLGVNVQRTSQWAWFCATILAAAATATVGSIAFLGLIAAHIAQVLFQQNYRWCIPAAALIGSTLVLCADMLARSLMPPAEISTGIIVAFIGAPCLCMLLTRMHKQGGAA